MLPILDRLYWPTWVINTALTGILAGFMISHSIMFGQFLSWFVASGKSDLLHQTYTVFRGETPWNNIYDIPLLLQLIVGLVFVGISLGLRRRSLFAVAAGAATVWVSILFLAFRVGVAEDAVLSGSADGGMAQYFLRINIPLHSTFAVIYSASFLVLLTFPILKREMRQVVPMAPAM
jgi:hypothetical protein